EIDDETLIAAAAYAQTLAVPARIKVNNSQIQRGEQLFADASCVACHTATFTTGSHKYPALENQTIHPYTDMLLHDMGEALADNRPDFEATGQEWRTPSLWGVGLAQTVLPYSGFLHDGRARTFEEAILWHGGEATESKETFANMNKDDRAALVRFLQSL
ncbi:MAG: di-heme oxidoredictase family protein, partial [Cyanobacteria bacterium J06576_12]